MILKIDDVIYSTEYDYNPEILRAQEEEERLSKYREWDY